MKIASWLAAIAILLVAFGIAIASIFLFQGSYTPSISSGLDTYQTVRNIEPSDKFNTALLVGILMFFSQLIIQATKTKVFGGLFNLLGDGGKIILVSTCTFIVTSGPLLMSKEVSPMEAFFTGGIGTALMVYGHQIFLVLSGKKGKNKITN